MEHTTRDFTASQATAAPAAPSAATTTAATATPSTSTTSPTRLSTAPPSSAASFSPSSSKANLSTLTDVESDAQLETDVEPIPMCESEVIQLVFSSIRTGLASISQFTKEFEKYLEDNKEYYSDEANQEKEVDNIVLRFNAADWMIRDNSLGLHEGKIRDLATRDNSLANRLQQQQQQKPKSGKESKLVGQKKSEKDVEKPSIEAQQLNESIKKQLVSSYFSANKNLFQKLLSEIVIEAPRFMKHEHSNAHSTSRSECHIEASSSRSFTVSFSKINRNLKKAEEILTSYKKKIDKLNQDCKSLSKIQSMRKKRNSMISQHHNAVEFSIFLAFKLFKFEILEYFLYIRDFISFNHEIWKVLNFREVYQTLYNIVLYFEYCSAIISMSKQKDSPISYVLPESQRAISLKKYDFNTDFFTESAGLGSKKRQSSGSEPTTGLSAKELMEEYLPRNKRFAEQLKKLSSFNAQIRAKKSLSLVEQNRYFQNLTEEKGQKFAGETLKNDNKLKTNLINYLYQQQSMYETFVNLVINYHIRYLKLINKFVEDNSDSSFFKTNLLPVKNQKLQFSSSNKFETLILLLRSKIKKNIVKLQAINTELDERFAESDQKVLSANKFDVLKEIPSLIIKSMKVFNDSFEYIQSLIPLFPITNRAPFPPIGAPLPPPPPIPASVLSSRPAPTLLRRNHKTNDNVINPYLPQRQLLRHPPRVQQQTHNANKVPPGLPVIAPVNISGRHGRASRQRLRHHIHNSQQNRNYYAYMQYYNQNVYGESQSGDIVESFLSTSWFIIHELKKKFHDLVLNSLTKYSKFLTTINDFDAFLNDNHASDGDIVNMKSNNNDGEIDLFMIHKNFENAFTKVMTGQASMNYLKDSDNDAPLKRRKLNDASSLNLSTSLSTSTHDLSSSSAAATPLASLQQASTPPPFEAPLSSIPKLKLPKPRSKARFEEVRTIIKDPRTLFVYLRYAVEKQYDELLQAIESEDNLPELTNFIII